MKKKVTIYWLIPAKPERELFTEVIRILAKEIGAPVFQPHLTLCARSDRESAGALLRQIETEPVRLRVREIAHSSKFTKTLFVRFAPAKFLGRLIRQISGESESLSDPHLSLVYKKLPTPIRRELAKTITLPFGQVTFDSIVAMSCVSPTETAQDVRSWRKLASKRLSG